MTVYIIIGLVALIIGGFIGFITFRYVLKGIYTSKIEEAEKEAEVMKEKKLLEVKEKFLNAFYYTFFFTKYQIIFLDIC